MLIKSLLNNSENNPVSPHHNSKFEIENVAKITLNDNNNLDDSFPKLNELKAYIDKVVFDMESRLTSQIIELEKRQNDKLDKIIETLSTMKNKS